MSDQQCDWTLPSVHRLSHPSHRQCPLLFVEPLVPSSITGSAIRHTDNARCSLWSLSCRPLSQAQPSVTQTMPAALCGASRAVLYHRLSHPSHRQCPLLFVEPLVPSSITGSAIRHTDNARCSLWSLSCRPLSQAQPSVTQTMPAALCGASRAVLYHRLSHPSHRQCPLLFVEPLVPSSITGSAIRHTDNARCSLWSLSCRPLSQAQPSVTQTMPAALCGASRAVLYHRLSHPSHRQCPLLFVEPLVPSSITGSAIRHTDNARCSLWSLSCRPLSQAQPSVTQTMPAALCGASRAVLYHRLSHPSHRQCPLLFVEPLVPSSITGSAIRHTDNARCSFWSLSCRPLSQAQPSVTQTMPAALCGASRAVLYHRLSHPSHRQCPLLFVEPLVPSSITGSAIRHTDNARCSLWSLSCRPLSQAQPSVTQTMPAALCGASRAVLYHRLSHPSHRQCPLLFVEPLVPSSITGSAIRHTDNARCSLWSLSCRPLSQAQPSVTQTMPAALCGASRAVLYHRLSHPSHRQCPLLFVEPLVPSSIILCLWAGHRLISL